MASLISFLPNTALTSSFPDSTGITRPDYPFLRRTHIGNLYNCKPSLRQTLTVTRFGLGQVHLPDPESTGRVIGDLLTRAEALMYTVADAAVSASVSTESVSNTKQNNDWFSGFANYMETVLKVLKNGLSTVHTPYAYGFAIILLTVLVKTATFPLSKKQVESAMAMRSLAPQIKAIQQRYAGNQEKIQLETARLYKLAGINPLAGCLPTLATIPVWIGLYRALSNVADEGLLTEGFFWIPSLSGPTTIAARQSGSGVSWLFPFIDGQLPLGWHDTLAYLVLPALLVLSQYLSVEIMRSTQPQSDDPNLKTSQAITKFLPLMIGYFSLSVPSGLSLYWLTNNILSTAQQIWLQKMGGANNPVQQFSRDVIDKEEESKVLKSDVIGEESKMLKSIFENTAIKEAPKHDKPASNGPRPGDRFRQLKEQEARRKQQVEEERKNAEAIAAEETPVMNGEAKKEFDSELLSVNGTSTSAESNKEPSIPRLENGEVSVNSNDGRDQQRYLQANTEKYMREVLGKYEASQTKVADNHEGKTVTTGEDEHQDISD